MFDIGFGEMLLIAAIALIAIGPKQLPEVARVIGRFLNEIRRATGDLTRTMNETQNSTRTAWQQIQRPLDQAMQSPPDRGQNSSSQETSQASTLTSSSESGDSKS